VAAAAVHDEAATLLRACGAESCATLCRRVNGLLENEIGRARASGASVACAPGCTFCCHQRVGVLPHEAIALVAYLRTRVPLAQRTEIERRIVANASRVDDMTVAEHLAANLRCALLRNGRCSVYEVRPAICAGFHSLSRERCEHSFNHPQDIGTPRNSRPALLEVKTLADELHAATASAYETAGKLSRKLELHQALRALLEDRCAPGAGSAGDALAGTRAT
jgi:Fe-S-cluster containining protein